MAQYGRNFYGASHYDVSGVMTGQFISDKTGLKRPIAYDPTIGIDGKMMSDGTITFDITARLQWAYYSYKDSLSAFPVDITNGKPHEDIIRYSGNWVDAGESFSASTVGSSVHISLTCSEFILRYVKRTDGAKIKVTMKEHTRSGIVDTPAFEMTVDTKEEVQVEVSNLPFKEYFVTIEIISAGVFEYSGFNAITTDVALDIRTNLVHVDSDAWGEWRDSPDGMVELTRTYIGTGQPKDHDNPLYFYTSNTGNLKGTKAYQFKLLLATSDDRTTPEILKLDIHTGNANYFAEDGYWKMLIDMGPDFNEGSGDSIDSVSWNSTRYNPNDDTPLGPDGEEIVFMDNSITEIRSRTTEDNAVETEWDSMVSWDYWTVPYSKATHRALLNLKGINFSQLSNNKINGGYLEEFIISPVYTPEFLREWATALPTYFVNHEDPITGEVYNEDKTPDPDNGVETSMYMKIEFLQEDGLTPIVRKNKKDTHTFFLTQQSYDIEKITLGLAEIDRPMRIKITFYVKIDRSTKYPLFGTPAIENINLVAQSEYIELRKFGEGTYNTNEKRADATKYYYEQHKNRVLTKYSGYGSAIFNDATGIDYIYKDGLPRLSLADIPSMSFIVPVGAENPEYFIEDINQETSMVPNMNFFWESNKGKDTGHQNDRLVIGVTPNGTSISLHRHFGSGETLKIESIDRDNSDMQIISNIYYPPLNSQKLQDMKYSFHLKNGFDDPDTVNKRVDVRWSSENELSILPDSDLRSPWLYRRNITTQSYEGERSDPAILASIVSARKGSIKRWVSEELILDGTVNEGSPVVQSSDTSLPLTRTFPISASKDLPKIPSNIITVDQNPYKAEIILGSVISNETVKEETRISLDYKVIDLFEETLDIVRVKDAKFIRGASSEDFLFRATTIEVHSIKDAKTGLLYARNIHYIINPRRKVDWSPGIDGGLSVPKEGDELLMDYSYYPIKSLTVKAKSNYNTMHYDLANIYRTKPIQYSANCRIGIDYVSPKYFINDLWSKMPNTVDKSTLKLKAKVIDNERINVYVDEDSVVGTLGMINPKENWNPSIQKGFYSIGKEEYFLYTSPDIHVFDDTTVPIAKNIEYIKNSYGQSVLLQTGTTNLLLNNDLNDRSGVGISMWDEVEYVWGNDNSDTLTGREYLVENDHVLYNKNSYYQGGGKFKINSTFTSNDIDKGVVVWYNKEIGYLSFILNKYQSRIERTLNNDTVIYEVRDLNYLELQDDIQVEIEVLINGYQYEFWIKTDDMAEPILLMEIYDTTFKKGYIGLYGDDGAKLEKYSISTEGINDWSSTLSKGSSMKFHNSIVEFNTNSKTYVSQSKNLQKNKTYTLSLSYIGEGLFVEVIKDNIAIVSQELDETGSKGSFTFTPTANGIYEIRIGSNKSELSTIWQPQLEEKAYASLYTRGVREDSKLTFPTENFNKNNGSISFWFKMIRNYNNEDLTLYYLNKDMWLRYKNGVMELKYGSTTTVLDIQLSPGERYYISSVWNNNDIIILNVFGKTSGENSTGYSDVNTTEVISGTDKIYILSEPDKAFDGQIDTILIYKESVESMATLVKHMNYDHITNDDVLMQVSFDRNSLQYDENRVTVPIVRIDTPIIVKTRSEDILERVYFTEMINDFGDLVYSLTNKEKFVYVPGRTLKILYEDLNKCSVYFIEQDRKTIVPFTRKGSYVHIDEEMESERGKDIVVEYIVRNSYCINYVPLRSQYELQFSNMNGEEYSVYAEGLLGKDKNLLKTVEMNPFKGTNGSGFIYIEDSPRMVETFDVKITPDSLLADGFDTATIVIDCYSKSGINTSNVDLRVSSTRGYASNTTDEAGSLPRYIDPDEELWVEYAIENGEKAAMARYGHLVTDEHRAGRFIYKYKARQMPITDDSGIEIIDNILIYDNQSGIGIKVPLRLVKEGVSY